MATTVETAPCPEKTAANTSRRGGILVTGVSSGIGRAIALELLQAEFHVFGTVRQPEDGRYLADAGGTPLLMDVTDAVSINRARAELEAALGNQPLVGLVNNAGIAICAPWECVALDDLRYQLEVNVVGVAAVCQAFLPRLHRGKGRIVMISSPSGHVAAPVMGPYCCSKFALEAMADSLRRELLFQGVKVISLVVGTTNTLIVDKARRLVMGRYAKALRAGAFGRFAEIAEHMERGGLPPEVVARAVRKVLTAKRPPAHLWVVRERAKTWLFLRLPERLKDRLYVKHVFGSTP